MRTSRAVALAARTDAHCIGEWNDSSTHEDVLAAFDKAIAAAPQ